jgi:putative membrane protein
MVVYPYYHRVGFGFGIIPFIFEVVFWVLIVAMIVSLVRGSKNQTNDETGTENNYIEIIKERYAKGEIDKKQFEQLKKDLA